MSEYGNKPRFYKVSGNADMYRSGQVPRYAGSSSLSSRKYRSVSSWNGICSMAVLAAGLSDGYGPEHGNHLPGSE
jgi:hypothetical protein